VFGAFYWSDILRLRVLLTERGMSDKNEGNAAEEVLLQRPVQNRAEWEGTGGGSIEYYDGRWWRSFDLVFLVAMVLALVALVVVSVFFHPEIFDDPVSYWPFWVSEVSKVLLESLIGFLGGLVVVYKNVKVNYTRKIQHLFAFLLPLLFHSFLPKPSSDTGLYKPVISACWGYWFVLLAFLVVIYPVRTRVRFVSVMFSCLDRPEDRPHTLKWMVTQVVLGYVIIQGFSVFCQYMQFYDAQALNYIAVNAKILAAVLHFQYAPSMPDCSAMGGWSVSTASNPRTPMRYASLACAK
jgi:hypothetical protein